MTGSHRRAKDDPASDLFDRWMSSRKADPEPTPEPTPEPVESAAEGPGPVATPAVVPAVVPVVVPAVAPAAGVSTDVEFEPRTAARRMVGWLVVFSVAGLAVAALVAYRDPTTLTVGLAATLFVLTLALWAIRAASPTTRLSVHSGQLVVLQSGGRFVFDLGGGYTPIEVVGSPDDRSWKVLFVRRNMTPFVVDASMVDPHAFMDTLRHYRPE